MTIVLIILGVLTLRGEGVGVLYKYGPDTPLALPIRPF